MVFLIITIFFINLFDAAIFPSDTVRKEFIRRGLKTPSYVASNGIDIKKFKEADDNEMLQFEEYKSQLQQRVAVVEQGMVRCGVRVAQLGTEEMIEFFYKLFNPGTVEKPINMSE